MFDWIAFLEQFSIPYVTKGPSVTRGHVAIKCPFCGNDPSEHLSISYEGKGWRCWRNPREHAGKSPARLIVALTGMSYGRAKEIAGEDRANIPNDLEQRVRDLLGGNASDASERTLSMPVEFKPIRNSPSFWPCINYLKRRGLDDLQIAKLSKRYGIRFCKRGPFANRIIFPVYYRERLMTYTGRSVSNDAKLRYKTLTTNPDIAKELRIQPAVAPINNYLLFFDDLIKSSAHTIVIVEGPFDALIMNILGKRYGVAATCIFTNTPTDRQCELFHELLPRFKRRCVMLDNDMYDRALRLSSNLRALDVEQINLPKGVKDPALLRAAQLKKIFPY